MNYENDYTYLNKKYPNPTGIITSMHFFHRSNYSTIVPVYQNSEIIGYYYVDAYIDPASVKVDLSIFTPEELLSRGYDYAIGQNIEHLAEISGNATLSTVAKRASWVSNAYDVATTINTIITFDGYLVWSSFIPDTPQDTVFPTFNEVFSIPSPPQ